MFGIESASGPAGAALVIGVVLVEALVLYVGYGVLESAVEPLVEKFLAGD